MCCANLRTTLMLSRTCGQHFLHQTSTIFSCPSPLRANLTYHKAEVTSKPQHQPTKATSSNHHRTTSSFRPTTAPVHSRSNDAVGPTFSCEFCERGGFPNRKALKYHLFRIHQVPMGKPEAHRPASSTSPEHSPLSATVVLGPTSVSSPSPPVSTFPLVREGDTLLIDFPITGDVTCPELSCGRKFVCKSWSSVVWSVKKHLRIFYNLPAITTRLRCGFCNDLFKPLKGHKCLHDIELYASNHSSQWRCEPCGISFPSALSLRNHLNGHKKSQLRDNVPKLFLPTTARKKTRRKRGNGSSHAGLDEPSVVTDCNEMLAPPVAQEPLLIDNVTTEEEDPGPLAHFHEAFDCLLEGPPSEDYFGTFERYVDDFANEAILHLFPEGSDRRVPSSSSSPPNMDDVKSSTSGTAAGLFGKSWAMPVSDVKSHSFLFKPSSLNVGKVEHLILTSTVRPSLRAALNFSTPSSHQRKFGPSLRKQRTRLQGPTGSPTIIYGLSTLVPSSFLGFSICVSGSEGFPPAGKPPPPFLLQREIFFG
ncbi:hypothetical protein CDAR_567151 [Caerostris darwini]|uniref:C2H2-type domain-containing protein n=1 Tax=Caerostris darwini TaxID=1538125 RepID=A0AAV4QZM5_9ARAC|nr:hypothetical protein CDAR_567151 [Caerostris darwini]